MIKQRCQDSVNTLWRLPITSARVVICDLEYSTDSPLRQWFRQSRPEDMEEIPLIRAFPDHLVRRGIDELAGFPERLKVRHRWYHVVDYEALVPTLPSTPCPPLSPMLWTVSRVTPYYCVKLDTVPHCRRGDRTPIATCPRRLLVI